MSPAGCAAQGLPGGPRAPLAAELALACVALVGALQALVGLVAQLLPLAGVRDYSSPLGPWLVLWIALANGLVAAAALFGLVTRVFRGGAATTAELVVGAAGGAAELGVAGFLLYAFRRAPAAVVYLATTALLGAALVYIAAHGRCQRAPPALATTRSVLSEFPAETLAGSRVGSEPALSDGRPSPALTACLPDAPRAPRRLSTGARIAAVAAPLALALCVQGFLCAEGALLGGLAPDPGLDRRVALHAYLDDAQDAGRYTARIGVRVLGPARAAGCITLFVHDQGQDSVTLLPLAQAVGGSCALALVDRFGHGLSDAGRQDVDLVAEARALNDVALLLAAEADPELAAACALRPGAARADARGLAACLRRQGVAPEALGPRFACVGHGSGAAVCLTWAKLAARLPGVSVTPVARVVGLDYYPAPRLLEAARGGDAAADLQRLGAAVAPLRVCLGPLGLAGRAFGGSGARHLADVAPAVPAPAARRFRLRTALAPFCEGYAATLAENRAFDTQAVALAEFDAQGLSPPTASLCLLVLSAKGCTRGPSTFECGLFASDEKRATALRSVTEGLRGELPTAAYSEYDGDPADLWRAPAAVAQWLAGALSEGVGAACALQPAVGGTPRPGTLAAPNTAPAPR